MNIFFLTDILKDKGAFRDIIGLLKKDVVSRISLRMEEQAYGYFAAAVHEVMNYPSLLVTARPELAQKYLEQLKTWLRNSDNLYLFPEIDLLSSNGKLDSYVCSERIKILSSLINDQDNQGNCNSMRPFIVTSILASASRSMEINDFKFHTIYIRLGQELKQADLIGKLESAAYQYDTPVELPGTFVIRGGIIDVFPSGRENPVRIEYFGDKVESIREYDARTQLSKGQLASVTIPPAKELPAERGSTIFDYLPFSSIIFMDDPARIAEELDKLGKEFAESDCREESRADTRLKSILEWTVINQKIDSVQNVIRLSPWSAAETIDIGDISLKGAPNFAGRFSVFVENLPALKHEIERIVIVSQQADRIKELLLEWGVETEKITSLEAVPQKSSFTLVQGAVDGGWQLGNELLLLTDRELFGIVKQRRSIKKRPFRYHWFLDDINTGDLVVHMEHGIGRFAGTVKRTDSGIEKEYVVLEYAGGDVLYVPVDQVDRISLYIGGGERPPSLSRLGSQEWNRSRQKVKESVANIARELIEIYAGRQANRGIKYSRDTLWQMELEASFPYVETPDQLEAVAAVKQDMESDKPMDRLVCGDVGYGKTEIAIRAAFKAVMEGKQVAMLVPTTILVQQHMNTFKERIGIFPVKIAALSRFCSAKEETDIIRRLAIGDIDICIGTHRLLQKDVQFKDLGLVIIDEEQRFGVIHKEYFKKIRKYVDVLTLSATPIPRTMHMALSGIRDMSTIETPPENRMPVATFVGEFNNRLVREAILRELERDGQVFVVHNRVNSIREIAFKIKELVPEAKIEIAHGQMDEAELERIMTDFVEGRANVLVSTTIIESGLDIPNVNTLIVDGADRLGLTQLYQLRGRVGRGTNLAYAYFLFDSDRKLTDQARERLKTIAQATELGSGFAIAMKDLEIRGAGNLLGVEQSGNIAAVGFNYYCQLLAEAVEEIKAGRSGIEIREKPEQPQVSIDLKLSAYIPEGYIENTRTRFNFYQRLAKCDTLQYVQTLREEMIDRFGPLPEEVVNLLFIVEMKIMAIKTGVEFIYRDDNELVISYKEDLKYGDISLPSSTKSVYKIGNKQIRIDLDKAADRWQDLLRLLLENVSRVPA